MGKVQLSGHIFRLIANNERCSLKWCPLNNLDLGVRIEVAAEGAVRRLFAAGPFPQHGWSVTLPKRKPFRHQVFGRAVIFLSQTLTALSP